MTSDEEPAPVNPRDYTIPSDDEPYPLHPSAEAPVTVVVEESEAEAEFTVPVTPQPAHRFPLASNGRLLDIAEVHPLVVTSTPKRPAPDGTPKTPAPDGTPKTPAPDGTPKTPAPDGTPKIRAQSSPRPRQKEATTTVVKITEKGIVAFSLFCYSHILFKIYIYKWGLNYILFHRCWCSYYHEAFLCS